MKRATYILFAGILATTLIVSCASTKKSTSPTDGVSSGAPLQDNAALAGTEDDSLEQKATISADGTVAEVVPHVGKDAVGTAAATPEASASESDSPSADSAGETASPKKETPEEKQARLAAEKAQKEAAKKAAADKKVADKKAAAAKKAAAKIEKQKKKDNYTGWVYIPKKNFTLVNGDIQITMRGSTGSFEIYAIPEAGKPIPLLATYDEFCSTYFSLMIGRKEYRLNREAGVKSEARKTEYGAQMAYTVPNKAQIVIDFSFMPSIATSSRVDMLRITIYTINLGKSTQAFTVKGMFDTMLGENTVTHFSTAAHRRINNEVQYTDMANEKWVRSENEKAAIQFLFDGKGITVPKCVTLGNKDFLSGASWVPPAQDTRSFSSVLSYNNSAVGVNWKTAYLDPMKTDVITFYISVATDGNEPAGKDFIASLKAGRTALPSNLPNTVQTTTVAPTPATVSPEETQTTYYENMPAIAGDSSAGKVLDTEAPEETSSAAIPAGTTASSATSGSTASNAAALNSSAPLYTSTSSASDATTKAAAAAGLSVLPETPVQKPAPVTGTATVQEYKPYTGSYPLSSVTKEQLDPDYIQNLLDRIADLESDPALVDKAEVKRLNEELDAILAILRSKN